MIISKIYDNGFFSMLFFVINHYLHAEKNKESFYLDTSDWLYKYKEGWSDYFESININREHEHSERKTFGHNQIASEFAVFDYKKIIPEIFRYNTKIKEYITSKYKELNLEKGKYNSIYIRRGCKLAYESKIYPSELYVEMLLEKDPTTQIIFVQTDDYSAYQDIYNYIKEKNLNIRVVTLCEQGQVGMSVTLDLNHMQTSIPRNQLYFNTIKSKVVTLNKMNTEDIYKHTLSLLAEIDITCNSKVCITDYQSNVARFIKLFHTEYDNVYDIENQQMNLEIESCPAYEKCVYSDIEKFRRT
jgi:hypothetical protein